MHLRRLFYWCHTTSRQPFETGIQRVTRRLGLALGCNGFEVMPVGRHEGSGLIEIIGRGTAAFELALDAAGGTPLLFIPELTADLVFRGADPAAMASAYGMRTMTLVHDLIPVKLRDHYSAAAVAMFTAFYESLARNDAVLATTHGVADELRRFLGDRGFRVPPIAVVPLPAQFGDQARVVDPAADAARGRASQARERCVLGAAQEPAAADQGGDGGAADRGDRADPRRSTRARSCLRCGSRRVACGSTRDRRHRTPTGRRAGGTRSRRVTPPCIPRGRKVSACLSGKAFGLDGPASAMTAPLWRRSHPAAGR